MILRQALASTFSIISTISYRLHHINIGVSALVAGLRFCSTTTVLATVLRIISTTPVVVTSFRHLSITTVPVTVYFYRFRLRQPPPTTMSIPGSFSGPNSPSGPSSPLSSLSSSPSAPSSSLSPPPRSPSPLPPSVLLPAEAGVLKKRKAEEELDEDDRAALANQQASPRKRVSN